MESSALKNPKHEAFASYLASGKSQAEAYRLAGYKPNDANAARLTGNDRIKKRVAELTAMKRNMVIGWAAIDTLVEMHRMIEIVDKALAAGDFRAAVDGQKFILTCFGYADNPTLSHEHLAQKPLKPREKHSAPDDRERNADEFGPASREILRQLGMEI